MTNKYTDCACATHVGKLETENHDWLLGIESRGVAGIAELTTMVADWPEVDHVDYRVSPRELPLFVAAHNWNDPAGMYQLALNLAEVHAADSRMHAQMRELDARVHDINRAALALAKDA